MGECDRLVAKMQDGEGGGFLVQDWKFSNTMT